MPDKFLSGKKTSKFETGVTIAANASVIDNITSKLDRLDENLNKRDDDLKRDFSEAIKQSHHTIMNDLGREISGVKAGVVCSNHSLLKTLVPILISKPMIFLNRIFKWYNTTFTAVIEYNTDNDLLGTYPGNMKRKIVKITNATLTIGPIVRSYNKQAQKHDWLDNYKRTKRVYKELKKSGEHFKIDVKFESDFCDNPVYILYI